MKAVRRIRSSRRQGRHVADRLRDRDVLVRRMGRLRKDRIAVSRSDQHEAGAVLGHAEIRTVHNRPFDPIAACPQLRDEDFEDAATFELNELRHVLHRHDIRPRIHDETGEVVQQLPLRVFPALGIPRERLTRGATDQDPRQPRREFLVQLALIDVGDVTPDEGGFVVFFEGKSARFVDIVTARDPEAFQPEAVRKRARAAEEIHHGPGGGIRLCEPVSPDRHPVAAGT